MRKMRLILPQRWHVAWQRVRYKKAVRVVLTLGLSSIVFFVVAFWVSNHLRPIITRMAKVRVDYLASSAINEAIMTKINEGKLDYNRLVYFEKDVNGQITALKTDMMAINKLKAEITGDVLEAIEGIGTSELDIPMGNLINGDIFAGRGPRISVRIVPLGSVNAEFEHVFLSAGINQTRHQILLTITVEISVLMTGYSASTSVSTGMTIAETIIVGNVPDSYFSMDDKIFPDSMK